MYDNYLMKIEIILLPSPFRLCRCEYCRYMLRVGIGHSRIGTSDFARNISDSLLGEKLYIDKRRIFVKPPIAQCKE